MTEQLPAVERLLSILLEQVPATEVQEKLEESGYLRHSDHPVSEEVIHFLLRKYLFEKELFDACKVLFDEALLAKLTNSRAGLSKDKKVENLLDSLGIPIFPFDWKYEIAALDFASERRKLKGNIETIHGVLTGAWTQLEALLKIMLIFYYKLFIKNLSDPELDEKFAIVLPANKSKPTLGTLVRVIQQINPLFENSPTNQHRRQACWQFCYRHNLFEGLDVDRLAEATNKYRNKLAHWDAAKLADVIGHDRGFVSGSWSSVQSVVEALRDYHLAPTTMVLISRGIDVFGKTMYGYMDEWMVKEWEKDGQNYDRFIRRGAMPLYWFYSDDSNSYQLYNTYLFVDPQDPHDYDPHSSKPERAFIHPLVSRNEVLQEYSKLI